VSGFQDILQRIVERVPGATGAVFADWEGESVGEFARELPLLEIRIVGAQWGVVWNELQRSFSRARLAPPTELIVDGEAGGALVRKVTDQYYVVLAVEKHAQLGRAMRELERGAAELAAEM
jgi:predicted regulator of Ras-like GTPase activity (Roadblock/LC7/MglB family)